MNPLAVGRLERLDTEAERTGVSVFQLRDLVRRGRVPGYRVGRFLLIRPTDLDEYVASRRVTPASAP